MNRTRISTPVALAWCLLALGSSVLLAEVPLLAGASPAEWAQRLARSEVRRRGDSLEAGKAPKARWDYTTGLLAHALLELDALRPDTDLAAAASRMITSYIAEDGRILTYKKEDYNIDMVTPGRALLTLYAKDKQERYKKALQQLRQQLAEHPRTSEGGFWHKQRYPHQMWLDGLYMASPFYARYAIAFGEPNSLEDVCRQILLIDKHLYDSKTSLYFHGWDEKRQQTWANAKTGCSPNFWGRGLGWFAMAVVDVLEVVPPTQHEVEAVNEVFRRVALGLERWQDPQTGLWWQVLDKGGAQGNYLEASASSMFVYALAKGVRLGYLSREQFEPVVWRAWEGLVTRFLREDAPGIWSLTQVCEVAGLGFTNSKGRARDGSYEYYLSEPVIDNDLKGLGSFILAGVEVERLAQAQPKAQVAAGWADQGTLLKRIQAPVFPSKDFPITHYGAKSGLDATGALRAAIEACHLAGGGRVLVPAGEWLSGAIHLKSRVNLHLQAGAVVRFSTNPSDYLPVVPTRWEGVECLNYSALIYAYGEEALAVTGQGILDGQASDQNWWTWKKGPQKPGRDRLVEMGRTGVPVEQRVFGDGYKLRPNFIQFYRCKSVLVEGVTLLNSPMWVIHPVLSENVIIRSVKVNSHGPNSDGCDPESSRDVLIEDCDFDTGDDCIAIKSGRNEDGRRLAVPSENLHVLGCRMKDGHGGVVIGSEISGGCRNVFVDRCEMDSPNLDRAIRIKSNATRGGFIEGVFVRDVRVGRVTEAVLTVDFLYEEGSKGAFPPVLRKLRMDRVSSRESPRAFWIASFPEAVIEDLRLSDCRFENVSAAERLDHVGSLALERVTLSPAKKTRTLNSPSNP